MEKLEYRCTTKNLLLCNGTIIILKITLLHSVSVITNFVIPDRPKITLFSSTAGTQLTIPTILGVVIEEVRASFGPPNFFDPISSYAAGAIENLCENASTAGKSLYL